MIALAKSFSGRISFALTGFISLSLLSCSSSKHMSKDVNYFYRKDNSYNTVVSCRPYFSSDSTLELYFHLNLKNLPLEQFKSKKQNTNGLIQFRFFLFGDEKGNNILDSATIYIKSDPAKRENRQYVFRKISCRKRNVVLRTELDDPASGRSFNNSTWWSFTSALSAPYFRLRYLPDSSFATENFFTHKDKVMIDYYDPRVKTLYIKYSGLVGIQAPPPFYRGNDKIPVANFEKSFPLENHSVLDFPLPGNYLIQADTTKKEGLWVNCFGDAYPFTESFSEYKNPLIYLTSTQEYATVDENKNIKQAVDEFWDKCAGSEKRGPMLADHYYTRVEVANELFTTSKEGWKSDRGMVYIVFGKPDEIYKASWGENWIYRDHFPNPPAEFHFNRTTHPWGEDFTLVRDGSLQRLWYMAVGGWRSGRAANE